MKKLAFKYLDTAYPNLYLRVTKFGNLMEGFDEVRMWSTLKLQMQLTVVNLFDVDFMTAIDIVKEWCDSRPKFQSIVNSTNEVVLVPTDCIIHSTKLKNEISTN